MESVPNGNGTSWIKTCGVSNRSNLLSIPGPINSKSESLLLDLWYGVPHVAPYRELSPRSTYCDVMHGTP